MSIFGLGVSAEIEIHLADNHKSIEQNNSKYPLYFDGDSITTNTLIRIKDSKKIDHQGIKIEFVGQIELFKDKNNPSEFITHSFELAAPSELRSNSTYDYTFKNIEKPYESYSGINVVLRYFVRVSIQRRLSPIVKELDIWVHSFRIPPEINQAIKMEVGIEDCLHIEFEYNKSKYHLRDVIVGTLFNPWREITGAPPNQYNESETITKFEIMDGAPVRGETIPIRLFLSGFSLTPTYRDINKKFSTRYYLNLVLVDEENRRYFKQQEITVYRIKDDIVEDIPGGKWCVGLASLN